MNEIERFLDEVCCGVGGSPELRRHLRKELREHLTEEIESNVAAGMSQEEATHKAIEEFGDPAALRTGLQAVHGRRLMALLIEKSMAWREATMKTGWKWSFVAQVTLILAIAAQGFFAIAGAIYVLPLIYSWHHDLGTPPVGYLATIGRLADGLYEHSLWIPCLLLVVVGWGLVEWKHRGQDKSAIRVTGLSLASLALFAVLALVYVPIVTDLAIIPQQIHDLRVNLTPEQAEKRVLPPIADGDAALQTLRAAIEQEDWPTAGQAAEEVEDIYSSLADIGAGTLALAGETQRDNFDEIREAIDAIEDSADEIDDRLAAYANSESKSADDLKVKVLNHLHILDATRTKLAGISDLFAIAGASNTTQ